MHYELYIDVFFLVNFMMDYIVLQVTRKMLKTQTSHVRICIGAASGAVLTCIIIVIPGLNAVVQFVLFHAVVNVVMIKIGLKIGWNKTFLKAYILLYISAFILGGVMEYLHQYIRAGSLFFVLALAGYYVSLGVWNLISYLAGQKAVRCAVRLFAGEKECTVEVLVDTGNRLRDMVTGKPVSIISRDAARKLWGDDLKGMRYIPYHTVGKAEGVMPLMVLDKMCVLRKEELWIEKPLVAVGEEQLTSDEYEMIMNPDIL